MTLKMRHSTAVKAVYQFTFIIMLIGSLAQFPHKVQQCREETSQLQSSPLLSFLSLSLPS